jgi:hypothetical protein
VLARQAWRGWHQAAGVPGVGGEGEGAIVRELRAAGVADRGLLVARECAQVVTGRADGESERLPEVVETGVVGMAGQDAAGDVLEAGAAQPAGDVAVGGAGHGLLSGRGGLHLTGRSPEDLQHGHATGGGVPHAGGDGAARAGNPGHLPHRPARIPQEADDQA